MEFHPKLLSLRAGPNKLPQYSNTCDMYFRKNDKGEVIQGKLYMGRRMVLDFDWGHEHKNKKSHEVFPVGVVHVQFYTITPKGTPNRHSNEARLMTKEEIEKYGKIILYYNPNAKFTLD